MMPEPDSSIQVLSHLCQLPINSIEGHWASGLQSMPLNYHIYFSVLPSAKTSDLFFPLDFNSAQSRRRSTIWPKDWNCRSAAEWCRHLVLKAQAIPTYQLVAPPCAMTLERRIFFLNISQGSPRLRFWWNFPMSKKIFDITALWIWYELNILCYSDFLPLINKQ